MWRCLRTINSGSEHTIPKYGMIVRVNRSHRMFREILEPQFGNAQLVQAFDLLLFALARGEYTLVYKSDKPQPGGGGTCGRVPGTCWP